MSRQRRFAVPLLGIVLAAAALAPPATATTLPAVDLGQQVDQAELVFLGTVLDTEAVPTADGAFAFTLVTFAVDETFKGSARGKYLTLRFAGGQVGTDIFEVSGMPRFEPGGQHLLFVEGNGRMGCPLVGWSQGKLDLVAHPLSGEATLVDAGGRAVTGIAGRNWQRGAPLVTAGGLLPETAEPGVVVLSQEGVEITVDEVIAPTQAAAAAPPAQQVLAGLRQLVRDRAKGPSYRAAAVVDSASPIDVPASFQFKAHPAPRH